EVRTGCRQHLSVVRESWWAPHLGRSFRDKTGVRVLNGDQLHVRHGDQVAQIGGVVERVPVAYLDGCDANGHGRPLRGRALSPAARAILAGGAISISYVDGDRTERRDSTREPARVAVAREPAHTNSILPQLCVGC